MSRLSGLAALTAGTLALAVAPSAALASGKAAGGGATGGGSTATTGGGGGSATGGGGSATGGGSTTGGGGGGTQKRGGETVPVPTPPAPPPPPPGPSCATLTSVTAPVGYFSTFAAVWNDYTVRSCSSGAQVVDVIVRDRNRSTGQDEYTAVLEYSLGSGQNVSGVVDNDFAPFNTDYDAIIEVRDTSGNLLDSSSAPATTPPPQ